MLLWLAVLSFLSGIVVMTVGFSHSGDGHVLLGGQLVGASLISYFLEWGLSSRARCPLCMIPPLHPKRCQKNRRAKRLLGSYRLQVATSVLFRDHFHCPYCGEATKIALKERPTTGRIDSSSTTSDNSWKR
jgi:DNA-directed RNA polymerase subunit RPC12/RpoP